MQSFQICLCPERACKVIIACAVLHNIAIMHNEEMEDGDDDGNIEQAIPPCATDDSGSGSGVRKHIVSTFFLDLICVIEVHVPIFFSRCYIDSALQS